MRHWMENGTLVLCPEEPLIAISEDQMAAAFEAALADRHGCSVVMLDLGQVHEVDSRGIGLVIGLNRSCHELGLELRARSLQPLVRRVFDLFQLGRLFTVELPPEPASARGD
jgi:anti-anti-sigma factor